MFVIIFETIILYMKSAVKTQTKAEQILDMLRDDVTTTIIKNKFNVSGTMIRQIKEQNAGLLYNTRHRTNDYKPANISKNVNGSKKEETITTPSNGKMSVTDRMAKARAAKAVKTSVNADVEILPVVNQPENIQPEVNKKQNISKSPVKTMNYQDHPKYDQVVDLIMQGGGYKDIQKKAGVSTNMIAQLKKDLGMKGRSRVARNQKPVEQPVADVAPKPATEIASVVAPAPAPEQQATVVQINPTDLISINTSIVGSTTTITINIKAR
jgi:hypothetical protein